MRILTGSYTIRNKTGLNYFDIDSQHDMINVLDKITTLPDPSWIDYDDKKNCVYLVNERENIENKCFVQRIFLNKDNDDQNQIIEIPGRSPCHMARSGQAIFTADYMSGTISKINLDENGGFLSSSVFVKHSGSGPNTERQESSHVHSVYLRNEGLWCCDLGIDQINLYHPENAQLLMMIRTPDGTGPRMLVFLNDSCFYAVAELSNEILQYNKSGAEWILTGRYSSRSNLHTVHPNKASHIEINRIKNVLYVSNRGDDTIATFGIESDTSLKLIAETKVDSSCPRFFLLDEKNCLILAAGQESHSVEFLAIDGNGVPVVTGTGFSVEAPVCLVKVSD